MPPADTADAAWLRRLRPVPDPAYRLVCFPHAGGSASFFRTLAQAVPPTAEVLAVQYPGRQERFGEKPVTDLAKMGEHIVRALRAGEALPTVFFGHSMGATLAFHVAQVLEGESRDGTAPDGTAPDGAAREDRGLEGEGPESGGLAGGGRDRGRRGPLGLFVSARRAPSRTSDRRVHLLNDTELLAELRKLSETQNPLLDDEEFVQMILPAVRGDYVALETYRPRPGARVTCPVVALRGDADPRVGAEEVAAWGEHTSSDFDLRVFSGGHFYLERHAAAVADLVSSCAERWRAG